MRTIDDLPLASRDREAIREAADGLRRSFPVTEIRLFGSKARGDADVESDIDLLVLTERPLTWRERDRVTDLLFEIEIRYDVVLSTFVVSETEWKHGPYQALPIHNEVERWGVAA